MGLPSDIVFDKIPARLAKVNPAERTLEAVFKFKITIDEKVVKTWSEFKSNFPRKAS